MRRAFILFILTAAAGCDDGAITGHILDATPGDADGGRGDAAVPEEDAGPPDAGPVTGLLTVRVLMAGVPVEGTQVAFHTAGGTLIDAQLTDSAGEVMGQVSDGGQVTTSFPLTQAALFTVTGVAPGEVITIDPIAIAAGDAGTLAVSSSTKASGATSYFAETCVSETPLPDVQVPTTFDLPAGCVGGGGTFDFLVRATAGGTGTVAYRQALDVTPDADMATDVAVAAPWRKDLAPATVSITAAAAFADSAAAGARAVRSDRSFHLGFANADVAPGEDAALEVPVPGAFAERVTVQAALIGEGASLLTQEMAPPGALAVTGADFLAPPEAIDVDGGGTGLRVTWDDQAPDADMQAIYLGHDVGDGLRTWVVVAPPGGGSVSLPDLPSPLDDEAPSLGDVVFVNVAAVETTLVEGYGQARATPGIVGSASVGFFPGVTGYTVRFAYAGVTP